MPDEVKSILLTTWTDYLKPLMPMIILMLALLFIAGMSILFLGNNNAVEQNIEKIVEAEAIGITSS